jgi:hypothetical protein
MESQPSAESDTAVVTFTVGGAPAMHVPGERKAFALR